MAATAPWMDVPNSTASTRSHTVTGLTNGATYGFRIRAVNAAGKGAVSDEVTATPLQRPSKPTGVTATPGHGQVTLTWDNPRRRHHHPVGGAAEAGQRQLRPLEGSFPPPMPAPPATR